MTIVEKGMKVFNEWEVRALTLISFSLQVILIAFGSKRKHTRSLWIMSLVWSAYMLADWVATLALGTLARKQHNNLLESFWVPFLLLHLGGPDTITAYSLEDNELWLRHFLSLVFQVGVAIYVFFRSLGTTGLSLIAVPVFVAATLKCGERTWVLWSSSSTQFRKHSKGEHLMETKNDDSENTLLQVDFFFTRLKVLFAGMKLHIDEGVRCYSQMMNKIERPEELAFRLVELELGLLYDVLYTKATMIYTFFGVFVRCFSMLASVSALVVFPNMMKRHSIAEHCSLNNVVVTYTLLCGAVFLELYALAMLVTSDWTKLWMVRHRRQKLHSNTIIKGKRWSGFIARYNFMSSCLKQGVRTRIQELLPCINEIFDDENVTWHQGIDEQLQRLIFQQVKEKVIRHMDNLLDAKLYKKLLNHRGDYVLEGISCLENLKWSTIKVEFDHSLILWHIATDLCYYDDIKKLGASNDCNALNRYSEISRQLSDYMLYLLIKCPNILPKGNGDIIYTEACQQAIGFFKSKKVGDIEIACEELLKLESSTRPAAEATMDIPIDEESAPKSILFDACRLAAQLQKLEALGEENWGWQKKWETINKVWVELLTYAAARCDWKQHAQQLTSGGELLTHVCVLMVNFGLSEQYQHRLPVSLFDRWIPIV
ncbi:hypothetical protein CCACVL1_13698 [Corchorus capsularis]|uniref:DUF4220 domain-containing protein n=1 Tax=Corchorus capsularis TaxID=210143 RepID=A0A1R3IA55_COCAP|nr:hypothetical protein CCACVL1_13698 [Corchorus capsularis]